MARDATARLYDVDANLTVLDKKAGTIAFKAKKGRTVNLDQLHESIWATRLGDRTGMILRWMDVNAEGEVTLSGKEIVLKVPGTAQHFVLREDSKAKAKNGKTVYQELRASLERGEKVVGVAGRLEGWQGNLTQLSSKLPGKPRTILVQDFQTGE